jgi:hypothetical protein
MLNKDVGCWILDTVNGSRLLVIDCKLTIPDLGPKLSGGSYADWQGEM